MSIERQTDTIVAPLTAPGRAAVAAVRISGPDARRALETIARMRCGALDRPRALVLTEIYDGAELLDSALVAFFPAPRSFTGEDCVEIHLHGSPLIVERLLSVLGALGIRLARPGEFSERAFLNGRIDLSQAEAIADVISAETTAQARVALKQLRGQVSEAVSGLGEPLRDLLAEIEAQIDFPEEEIPPASYESWSKTMTAVRERIQSLLESYSTGRICREGATVVLVGEPNVGKSSLLNRIAGSERAIVTPIPGTTRDSIEERINLDGLFVRLWDTAGLAEDGAGRALDEVERLGIERSWKKADEADVILFVYDAAGEAPSGAALEKLRTTGAKVILVANKCDLPGAKGSGFSVSAKTGEGIEALLTTLKNELVGDAAAMDRLLITNARHHEALLLSAECLNGAADALEKRVPPEFVALELRAALSALNDIIGITYTEDILGRIFSRFCIGK